MSAREGGNRIRLIEIHRHEPRRGQLRELVGYPAAGLFENVAKYQCGAGLRAGARAIAPSDRRPRGAGDWTYLCVSVSIV